MNPNENQSLNKIKCSLTSASNVRIYFFFQHNISHFPIFRQRKSKLKLVWFFGERGGGGGGEEKESGHLPKPGA